MDKNVRILAYIISGIFIGFVLFSGSGFVMNIAMLFLATIMLLVARLLPK